MDVLQDMAIEELLNSPVGQKINQAMEVIAEVQQNLCALAESENGARLDLLKIGTVFQIFLVDTLASGKSPKEISADEWGDIARKVSKYAVLEDDQSYSEFVFTLYADNIDLSAKSISRIISKEANASIKALSTEIRRETTLLRKGAVSETEYVETCLWLSLEAMVKLLSSSLTVLIGTEYSRLAQAVSQLAFEYGRYVLYAKEQAILAEYIENQYVLDEQLQERYNAFRAEVQAQSDKFRYLISEAFSPDIRNTLMQSAELARAAGVREEELLTSLDDIDAFFLD